MRKIVALALALMALLALPARAENDGDCVYTLLDRSGNVLTMRAGRMYAGDEYIAADNREYRVVAADDAAMTATAEYVSDSASEAFAANTDAKADGNRLICMYSTHSDESYVPDDGTESKWQGAGIYDVGDSLKAALAKKGIEAVYSHETFLPHDADAYTRSRRTAEELLKKGPDALIDIHRDAVPARQYETEVDGEDISKVRLFVGRNNQNSAENKAFAKQIKAEADREYPGLIKDIFIGKGNYNQELYPHALLLEFGTHEIEKEKAEAATGYMAEVLDNVLYGASAKAEGAKGATRRGVAGGVGWVVGLAILAAAVYGLASTGSVRGAWEKAGRHLSEMTGGLIGKKPGK